jgi:hypothetical protein
MEENKIITQNQKKNSENKNVIPIKPIYLCEYPVYKMVDFLHR